MMATCNTRLQTSCRAGTFKLPSPWRELRYFETLNSTRQHANALVSAGEDLRGIAFWAESQGVGRNPAVRGWDSNEGGLNVAAVLPTVRALDEHWSGWLPLLAGSTFIRMVHELFDIEARLKWPNEAVIGGERVALFGGSMLCGSLCGDYPWRQTLLEMKVNWLNKIPGPQPAGDFRVTRVADHVRGLMTEGRRAFLVAWLARAEQAIRTFVAEPEGAGRLMHREMEEQLWWRGQEAAYDESEWGEIKGVLTGLGPCGSARLRLGGGQIVEIHNGRQVPGLEEKSN